MGRIAALARNFPPERIVPGTVLFRRRVRGFVTDRYTLYVYMFARIVHNEIVANHIKDIE